MTNDPTIEANFICERRMYRNAHGLDIIEWILVDGEAPNFNDRYETIIVTEVAKDANGQPIDAKRSVFFAADSIADAFDKLPTIMKDAATKLKDQYAEHVKKQQTQIVVPNFSQAGKEAFIKNRNRFNGIQ